MAHVLSTATATTFGVARILWPDKNSSVPGLKLCSVLHNKPAEQTQLARVKQVEAEEEEKIKKRFVPKLKAISFHSFWQRES